MPGAKAGLELPGLNTFRDRFGSESDKAFGSRSADPRPAPGNQCHLILKIHIPRSFDL
jgi:hypothetical protein